MPVHSNSIATYRGIPLSDREAAVVAVYHAHGELTDDEVAQHLGMANSREVSPRITELRSRGVLIENKTGGTKGRRTVRTCRLVDKPVKQEEPKAFCNCTFAGHLKKLPSQKRKGMVAVVCTNPVHGKPILYGYEVAE